MRRVAWPPSSQVTGNPVTWSLFKDGREVKSTYLFDVRDVLTLLYMYVHTHSSSSSGHRQQMC